MTPKKSFHTRAAHAGEHLDRQDLRPVSGAIYPSVGYTFPSSGELDAVLSGAPGFVYSTRYANPTVDAFEQAVADLEGAEAGLAFASGMAAVHAALLSSILRPGVSKAIVAAADVYGATYSLLQSVFTQLGVSVHFVDVLDLDALRRAVVQTRPAAVWVETISNPLLKVADLPAQAEIARQTGARLLVDNTFCTPYLCNPLAFGADMVIHSATKYLAGHGDVMAGVLATSAALKAEMVPLFKLIGSSLGPFEAWLALRGLKTLPLRLRQQCQGARVLANWLQNHPRVNQVYYPYLPSHPQHELARFLTSGRGAGAVLSFEIRDAGRAEVFTFMDALKLIQPATTLGDLYSLLLYPAISSHRTLTPEERAARGISEGLVRLSVGIEDVEDIQADLEQALDSLN